MQRIRLAWQTISGLLTVADLLNFVGFWLFRGTLRRTVAVAVALCAVLIIGRSKSVDTGLTVQSAVKGTGAIFVISCIGGLGLMLISGSVSKAALTTAEAKGAPLLEEMKKDRKELHRDRLWRQVYRYEQVLHPDADVKREQQIVDAHRTDLADMCDPARAARFEEAKRAQLDAIITQLGLTADGWKILFEYGLQVPMGRSVLKYRHRYNLSKIKDWYDGAPFHHTDVKLREQYEGSEELGEIKQQTPRSLWFRMVESRTRLAQRMWFRVITRAVQVRVAQACRRLDRKYAPYSFSCDHFLWPTPQVEQMLRDRLGEEAVDELTATRRHLFHKVFHQDVDLAHKLLHKAIYPTFALATELRRGFDPQYVVGALDDQWCEDVHRYDRAFRQTPLAEMRRQQFRRAARQEQRAFDEYLKQHAELIPADDPMAQRAARVAFHVNRDGLKTMILEGRDPHDDRPIGRRASWLGRRAVTIATTLRQVVAESDHYSRKLRAVRVHHELARLELEDYEFYLERILT